MLKLLFRNAIRNKLYYGINLVGLVLGITAAVFIYLYLQSEMTYDKHFADSERIYRLALNRVYPSNEVAWAAVPPPMCKAAKENFPEVEATTRMFQTGVDIQIGNQFFDEKNGIYAESNFFEIFNFSVIQGDLSLALTSPNQLVLTESTSNKYFGTSYSVGKQLVVYDTLNYQVSAVIADIPINTHFNADIILPIQDGGIEDIENEWGNFFFLYTYIKLKDQADVVEFEPKMRDRFLHLLSENTGNHDFQAWIDGGNSYDYFLQPLTDIHLKSDLRTEFMVNGEESNVQLFMSIGIFLLVISGINYINLSTARAGKRMRELGLKKIMGATRRTLIYQLLNESLLLTILSGLIALLLVQQLLPSFNDLAVKDWNLFTILNPKFLFLFGSFVIVLGISAGIYPALKLSNAEPVKIISTSGKNGTESSQERWIRNLLVGLQFGVSFVVIVSTLIVIRQNNYLNSLDLGYDKENVLVIENGYHIENRQEVFRQEILKNSKITHGSIISAVPGFIFNGTTYGKTTSDDPVNVTSLFSDQYAPEVLGLDIVAGRDFRAEDFNDTLSSALINENAVKRLGWTLEEAVGQNIVNLTSDRTVKVIGVLKDFHTQSAKFAIRPVVLLENNGNGNNLVFRVKEKNLKATIAYISTIWSKFSPSKPIEYSFLDDKLETLYINESNTQDLFSIFTALALFLAAFGMYGLSAYLTELKRKEVAIRKTLGASEFWILKYFTLKQLGVISLAIVIGLPISLYLGSQWLDNFVYHIEIDFVLILMAVSSLVLVGLLSIAWFSVKAALENPVNMLRE